MRLLEKFAGSRSVGKEAQKLDIEVFSTDIENFEGIDYAVDLLEFDYTKAPEQFDIAWASTICTGFSVAAIGHHWTGGKGAYIPKSDTARLSIALAKKTIEMILHYQEKNKNIIYFIENPRGLLRKMPFMDEFLRATGGVRHTVTYCQYGDERMKPTDIWTNCHTWKPKPMCKNGDTCHVAAPRGAKTGTQGRKGAYDRSKIPPALCREILQASIIQVKGTGNGGV